MHTEGNQRRRQGFLHQASLPSGFAYLPGFLTAIEEATLVLELETLDWEGRGAFRRRGQLVKRRELDFGYDYGRHAKSLSRGLPLPMFLVDLRAALAVLLEMEPTAFRQVIAARYTPGAGIDWHIDANVFGEPICGISLGESCQLQFRRDAKAHPWTVTVQPRSLYLLEGSARWQFQHRVRPLKATRYAITFRPLKTLSATGAKR